MSKRIYILNFLLLSVFPLAAQKSVDLDSAFIKAQSLASQKDYSASRNLSRYILKMNSGYTDASILIGRTYAWQSEYDSARLVLSQIIAEYPVPDAFYALAQLEFWSGNYKKSLVHIHQVMEHDSTHIPALLIKSTLLLQLDKFDEAEEALNYILSIDDKNKSALDILKKLKNVRQVNQLMASYQITSFNKGVPVRQLLSLEYLYNSSKIKYIGRVRYADQQVWKSLQAELEGYIAISDKGNLLLNTGISDGNFFPVYRAGGEVFYLFPYKVEASVGARTLLFKDNTVILYTGQVGKYLKKKWLSARVYLQKKNDHIRSTGIIQLRHYLKSNDEYLSITLSKGSIPSSTFGKDEVYRLNSSSLGISGQFSINNNILVRTLISYEHEEYMADVYRHRLNGGLSTIIRF